MNKKNSYVFLIIIFGVFFFFIGFGLAINAYLIPFLQGAFQLSSAQSYLVLAASYSAFVLFGYPSGILIRKYGYKKSMVASFFLFTLGFALFIPSSSAQSFVLFLLASFISGMGNTLLQAAVNPYITILGNPESAAKRICIMGIFNKFAWALAPIFLSLFLDLKKIEISEMSFPFMIILSIFLLLGIITIFLPLPEIEAPSTENATGDDAVINEKSSVFQFPHLLLGVLALFLYSGVESIALSTMVDFANNVGLDNPETYVSYTVFFMCVGYILGVILIPRYVSQRNMLRFFALLGGASVLLVLFSPSHLSFWFVALLGLANSIMWPAIWPLALHGLGRFTKEGSSLLVMGIVGGALMPLLFGWTVDLCTSHQINMQMAYAICFLPYLYIFYYANNGYRVGLSKQ